MITVVILFGALAGAGIFLLVTLLDQRPVSGPSALARLDLDRQRFRRDSVLTVDDRFVGESLRLRRVGAQLREVMEARGIGLPTSVRADLAMTARSVEGHIATSLVCGVIGVAIPVAFGIVLVALGITAVGLVPLWGALLLGGLGAVLPTLQLRGTAADRRRDFRHVISSFLDLVAMNLSGGRGVPEALDTASGISQGWGMRLIRDTLRTARLQGVTPWSALGRMGDELQIDELRDLAAALGLVAEDGAKVRDSLYARADSMRQRELAEAEGRAQARSQSMLVAQLLLCVGFLIFLTYPAIARVLSSGL